MHDSDDWPRVRAWRRAQREELIERRLALSNAGRRAAQAAISRCLLDGADTLPIACVGYYWPFKGEVDLHTCIKLLAERGAIGALPVVLAKGAPMVFRAWSPGQPLARGIWDIPIPAQDERVQPTLLLVPLVGFDRAGYRLGYGGGYYDRTLAALSPRPLTIGIGYACTRLDTIHPQAHDIALDRILTEEGWFDVERKESLMHEPASSPCQMAAVDPAYMGFLRDDEVVALLNELLTAERAGARGVATMAKRAEVEDGHSLLQAVARDEASFCAMLSRHLKRLHAEPTQVTGSFYDKLVAMDDYLQQLAFLNRGQCWVVRKLREALPRVRDAELAGDLRHMLDVHVRNIEACDGVLAGLGGNPGRR
ncbi:MAG: 5-formyltetrahydrofolate cyclo-ligase [Gammaproteobacteria bacterium]